MKFFQIYQYVVPGILFPLSYWLWWTRYDHDHRMTLLALVPVVLFAYVVPGIGTNVLRLWEFNTRLRIGRFRPQHGFVFGTATSLLTLACLPFPAAETGPWGWARAALVVGSVLAFWNWLYDQHAIRSGFLVVYNRAFSENRGPEAIAAEYCPSFFAATGAVYGLVIRVSEYVVITLESPEHFWILLVGATAALLVIPAAVFVASNHLAHGQSGLTSYAPHITPSSTGSTGSPDTADS